VLGSESIVLRSVQLCTCSKYINNGSWKPVDTWSLSD